MAAMAKLCALLSLAVLLAQLQCGTGSLLRTASAANEVTSPLTGASPSAVTTQLLNVLEDYLEYYEQENVSWVQSEAAMDAIINTALTDQSRASSIDEKARMKKEHDDGVHEYAEVVRALDAALTSAQPDWKDSHPDIQARVDALYKEVPISLLAEVHVKPAKGARKRTPPTAEVLRQASVQADDAIRRLESFRQRFSLEQPKFHHVRWQMVGKSDKGKS
eukprot:TRINITY_DN105925_c0_g1_i1.p1 TRINITY_DN105925_c0_g1~~TRINITY_DN105925_c0_g1_i1.p1  ORF type:complete len:220 (+),score=53.87 TRINITY_DN105925_c0_g1_i1:29-688(+)